MYKAPRTCSVAARMLAVGLSLVCIHVGKAAAQVGASALAAPSLGERRLCGGASDSKPRVLIGRFLLFGDFDPAVARTLEPAFVGAMVAALLNRREASIFVWGPDGGDLRPFKELNDLIDGIFVAGTPEVGSEQDRQRESLAPKLRGNNCDYLFGGRISKEKDLINVNGYLLDTETGAALRPFSGSLGDTQSVLMIAERFSNELISYLQRSRGHAYERAVEVGCLSVAFPVPNSLRPVAEVVVGALRRRLVQSLSSDQRFRVESSIDDAALCPTDTKVAIESLAASVVAELQVTRENVEVHPLIRIFEHNDVAGPRSFPISLSAIKRPMLTAARLPDDYAVRVRSFLVAAIREDGSFPKETEIGRPAGSELLTVLQSQFAAGKPEVAVLTALSADPDGGAAFYALGKALQGKGESQLALESLLIAKQEELGFPQSARADLNEDLAATYAALRNQEDAAKYLAEAKGLYEAEGRSEDSRRVTRKLAAAWYRTGKRDEALEEVQKLSQLDTDNLSLRMLGAFSFLSNQYAEAEKWLTKALVADPGDEESKGYLAEVYGSLGRKELFNRHYVDAKRYFDRSLERRENSQVRYLAGAASYENDDLRETISQYERIVAGPYESPSPKWYQSAWLTLLECYLLQGEYDLLESRGKEANSVFSSLPDHRLLAAYLRFMGRVLGATSMSVAELMEHPAYNDIKSAPPTASAKALNWNNDKVDRYVQKQALAADRAALVEEIGKIVWRDPAAGSPASP